MKGNMMILTSYEWEERLTNLVEMAKAGQIHPVTAVADLTHLWRHVDGEVFPASTSNDVRQDLLWSACSSVFNITPKSLAKVVKEQRTREGLS